MISHHRHNTMTMVVARDHRSLIATGRALSYEIPSAHKLCDEHSPPPLHPLPFPPGVPRRHPRPEYFFKLCRSRENRFPIRPIYQMRQSNFKFRRLGRTFPLTGSNPLSAQLSTKRTRQRSAPKNPWGRWQWDRAKSHPRVSSLVKLSRSQQTTTLPGTAPLTSTLVDAPRARISRDVIRGGHVITAKGWERRWDAVVCDENLPNRCSRHFDPRQTGVRRRRSPSAAHAPRKRSGLRYRTWAEVHPRRGRYGRRDRSLKPTGGELLVRIRDCENAIQPYFWASFKPIPLLFELLLFFLSYPSLLASLIVVSGAG